MSKCLATKTSEDHLELTAQTNNTLTAIKLALLEKQVERGIVFNTKEYITESGDFTVPVTGYYKITIIAGGSGANVHPTDNFAKTGAAGSRREITQFLTKGQIIPVIVGASGIGVLGPYSSIVYGGNSKFGDFLSSYAVDDPSVTHWGKLNYINATFAIASALGPNARLDYSDASMDLTGHFPGGGGSLILNNITGVNKAGDGASGCIIVEYFDPKKDSLPIINDTDLIPYIALLKTLEEQKLRIDTLEKAFAENVCYNDEITITESGDFEVPYDGYYEVTCIGGGHGAIIESEPNGAVGQGLRGSEYTCFKFLEKGQIVNVTIGAPGNGYRGPWVSHPDTIVGGVTYFDDVNSQTDGYKSQGAVWLNIYPGSSGMAAILALPGVGKGINQWDDNNLEVEVPAQTNEYGTGGGCRDYINCNNNTWSMTKPVQGAVRLRFHNPNKN